MWSSTSRARSSCAFLDDERRRNRHHVAFDARLQKDDAGAQRLRVTTADAVAASRSCTPQSRPRPRTSSTPRCDRSELRVAGRMVSPRRSARLGSPSRSISSIVASAAAHPSGFPRYVDVWSASPVESGHASMTFGASDRRADRNARAHRLADAEDVGDDALALDRKPRAGAAESGVDLVDDHHDAQVRRTWRAARQDTPAEERCTPPALGSAR